MARFSVNISCFHELIKPFSHFHNTQLYHPAMVPTFIFYKFIINNVIICEILLSEILIFIYHRTYFIITMHSVFSVVQNCTAKLLVTKNPERELVIADENF